ncbi:M3 family metallopeptidase [Paraburkholderia sp. BL21I4N1]|uniref:M3 family metallopeptidase n=1 Tax=Paraburkholderia sp. BL21I4N1 TaxID=1938801 RepID=UPI000CFAC121|nr:M3 family metallopeptidase [Paraburkholderia sp. BL21I4N1]PQV50071.1 peptidase M3-like protein [Paraburkholderia sp. BL21I4N1]
MQNARAFFDELNQHYLQLLRTEGELYWATHTGQSNEHEALGAASLRRKMYAADAARLARCREYLSVLDAAAASPERDALVSGLRGWVAVFEANAIGTDRAAALLSELTERDVDLYARRQAYTMNHIGAEGRRENASPAALRSNLASNPDASSRQSSHEALHGLERWVVENGFVDIVGKRNELARELGYRNFFDYRLQMNSGMTPEQLFEIFDGFESSTRDAHQQSLHRLVSEHGEQALLPRNLMYLMRGGDSQRHEAYFPFGKALERWAESFRRMGVSYRGARLEIDLLDRQGKFPTGFCIAPTPGYRDDTHGWMPADVRFTSTARPQQAGAGLQGLNVLFHEAGHAAHYANVTRNSPCFAQEFAPSSPALLEAQAKFFDALPADPCWLRRYAMDAAGKPMPEEAIRARVEARQAFLAYSERRDLVPTYFEWALYNMDDAQRTPDSILELARSVTKRILGIAGHTNYVLATPHPIYHDIAVYYHGYLLARMAAAQTRAYLIQSLGYIVDNPAVGPLLAEHYWAPGNSATLDQTLFALTGETLNVSYLAAECNRSAADAWQQSQEAFRRSEQATPSLQRGDLDASISIVHGAQRIASNDESLSALYAEFEAWAARLGSAA